MHAAHWDSRTIFTFGPLWLLEQTHMYLGYIALSHRQAASRCAMLYHRTHSLCRTQQGDHHLRLPYADIHMQPGLDHQGTCKHSILARMAHDSIEWPSFAVSGAGSCRQDCPAELSHWRCFFPVESVRCCWGGHYCLIVFHRRCCNVTVWENTANEGGTPGMQSDIYAIKHHVLWLYCIRNSIEGSLWNKSYATQLAGSLLEYCALDVSIVSKLLQQSSDATDLQQAV